MLKPFFDQYLKDGAPKADTPPVFIYNTGENHWDRFKSWPLACANGCAAKPTPLYLTAGFGLSFTAPSRDAVDPTPAAFDEYVSDPAKPVSVPAASGPLRRRRRLAHVAAARSAVRRRSPGRADLPDTGARPKPVRIGGAPVVNLVASTSGTDSDWVVKLIDVYPDEVPSQPEMGGYQLAVAMDIFRGRYRESFETPKAIAPNTPLAVPVHAADGEPRLPAGAPHHGAGPVELVPALRSQPADLRARTSSSRSPADYVKATQRVYHAAGAASAIELPVVTLASAGTP